jgi:hypothetical protein
LENPGVRWEDNIKIDFREVKMGIDWLRIGTAGGHL